jgi:hypothetical protein
MSGIPLTIFLPEFGSATSDTAQRWVAAALTYATALSAYDRWLYPRDSARQTAAQHLHDAWQAWLEDAETVVQQAETLAATENEMPGLGALLDEISFRQGMLQMSPSLISQRREQVERGEVYSKEEVRRELRAGSRG